MRIAVLHEPGRFDLADVQEPTVGPGEVLLRVSACGVCASELPAFMGNVPHLQLPWYPGHEVSGVVEEVGEDVDHLQPGDPMAAWVTARGFAERVVVPAAHCFSAGTVPLELALGEPLACAVNAVEFAAPALGDDVVIVGAGFMGHLIHKLVLLRGPRHVIVADTRPDALERARGFGATATVDVTTDSFSEVVGDLTNGKGADVTFEVTGVQPALESLDKVTRMSGTLVIAGYHQGAPRSIPLENWNWMAYRIVNAHFRDVSAILTGMRRGMRLLTSGRISMDGLVTHRFSLDEIQRAFSTAVEKPRGYVKATVEP